MKTVKDLLKEWNLNESNINIRDLKVGDKVVLKSIYSTKDNPIYVKGTITIVAKEYFKLDSYPEPLDFFNYDNWDIIKVVGI